MANSGSPQVDAFLLSVNKAAMRAALDFDASVAANGAVLKLGSALTALGSNNALVDYLPRADGQGGIKWQVNPAAKASKLDVQNTTLGATVLPSSLVNQGLLNSDTLTVSQNSYWTPSGPMKYVAGPTAEKVFLQSTYDARDIEVSTFTRNGIFYLRIKNDRAMYFHLNGEANALEVGIANNISSTPVKTRLFTYNYYVDATALGYDKAITENVIWTVGISGMDAYFKYNGVELSRFKHIGLFQPSAGQVGLAAVTGYGFRDIEIKALPETTQYSDLSTNTFDLRDFGLKDLKAVGSIEAGSNILTLSSNPGFVVGDKLIVATGSEPGGGHPGTVGVGGNWPRLSYADATSMTSDTTQPSGKVAWVEDTGEVWQYLSGSWSKRQQSAWYTHKAVPIALIAKITAVSGNTLTLDKPAISAAKLASVYFANDENAGFLLAENPYGATGYSLLPSKCTVKFPAGRFAFSLDLFVNHTARHGYKILGAGVNQTELFSPPGAPSFTMRFAGVNGIIVRDLTLRGNARVSGFGFGLSASSPQNDFVVGYPSGITFSACTDCLVRDVCVIDAWQALVGFSYCNSCYAENCELKLTDGLFQYIQWLMNISDSLDCAASNITIYSPIMTAGLETFRSSGTIYRDIRLTNCGVSMNSSGGFLFENIDVTLEEDSCPTNGTWSTSNAIINVNSNIQPPDPSMLMGGTIRNPRIIQKGILNEVDYNGIGIVVNKYNPNITIEGTYDGSKTHHLDVFKAPDALASGGVQRGSIGINSTGKNTVIKNIRVAGKSPFSAGGSGLRNINATGDGSSVIDCIADDVNVSGAGSTETGTRTNAVYGVGP